MTEQRPSEPGYSFAFFRWALTLDREIHVKRVGWHCIVCQAQWVLRNG